MSLPKTITTTMVGIAALALAGAAQAATCQAPVSGTDSAKGNNALARIRAVNAWRDAALSTYGNGYGIWLKATGKNTTCQISGSFPKTHSCTAVATPCK